jgi:hypothetical protein
MLELRVGQEVWMIRCQPTSETPGANANANANGFSNDVLDLFINRPIAIDIDVDAGYTLPSMDGDDLVGVDPNRDAVGQGELVEHAKER